MPSKDLYRIMEWFPFETRPMDDEEREHWSTQLGYDIPDEEAVIFCSTLPDDGQEVLVCNKWGHVWIDEFENDPDYGVGLETNGDLDGVLRGCLCLGRWRWSDEMRILP